MTRIIPHEFVLYKVFLPIFFFTKHRCFIPTRTHWDYNKPISINLDAEYNIGQQKPATLKMYEPETKHLQPMDIKKKKKNSVVIMRQILESNVYVASED